MTANIQYHKHIGHSKNSFKKGSFRNTILPQKIRKVSSKYPNLNLKQLEKEE